MISLSNGPSGDGSDSEPLFRVGQLVRHVRYGYRGVIVEVNESFGGTEEWYQSNQTQPPKDQPWYHVLVDGMMHSTYAAESSLAADDTGQPVNHPLVKLFFSSFSPEGYIRNEMPWTL